MKLPRRLVRWLSLVVLLVLVALLRAEQGVAELQGRVGEPSRLVRLTPDPVGGWRAAFLGFEGRFPTETVVVRDVRHLLNLLEDQAKRIRKALP